MTTRATARHRALVRPSTPLSALSSSVTGHVGTIGRGGVVLAMSSGLVATMGIPANAVTGTAAAPEAATPAAEAAFAFQSALLAAPATLEATTPLTAPVTANVTFDTGAFSAVPAPKKRVTAAGQSGSSYVSGGFGSARGSSVIAIAARYIGVPYVYGGTTPAGWDCSGAVRYIYAQLGISLPRTANEQMAATRRVSRSEAVPGDLVFITSGGRAYHVGIYAGGNMMYDAGRSGRSFSKREIFSSSVVFGRV